MSAKKDGRGMLDMLEKMGMIKKIESDVKADGVYNEQITEDYSDTASESGHMTGQEPSSTAPDSEQDAYSPMPSYAPEYTPPTDNQVSSDFWDNNPHSAPPVSASGDTFTAIDALYASFGLPSKGTNTIFIIDEFLKTLPDSLPLEIKRSIVLKIVDTSGFDFDALLSDGLDRVSRLNEYAATFSARTDELLSRHTAEIETLERQISQIKEVMSERKNLHKKQFLAIDSEAQRLKEILDFITK